MSQSGLDLVDPLAGCLAAFVSSQDVEKEAGHFGNLPPLFPSHSPSPYLSTRKSSDSCIFPFPAVIAQQRHPIESLKIKGPSKVLVATVRAHQVPVEYFWWMLHLRIIVTQ